MNKLFFVISFAFLIATLTFAQTVTVKSIHGAKTISVLENKKKKTVKVGQKLNAPVTFTTDKHTEVKFTDQDKNEVSLGKSTTFTVRKKSTKKDAETQWNDLGLGSVRAVVNKKAKGAKDFSYGIHTKTAVMGVRGTDFIAESEASKTSLHTLEGEVHAAKDQKSLESGGGTSVLQNQFIEATKSSITPPQGFSKDEFLKSFEQNKMSIVNQAKVTATSDAAKDQAMQKATELKDKMSNSKPSTPETTDIAKPALPAAPAIPQQAPVLPQIKKPF